MKTIGERIKDAHNIASLDFNTLNDLAKVCKLLELQTLLNFIEHKINTSTEELSDDHNSLFKQTDSLFGGLYSAYSELFHKAQIKQLITAIATPQLVNECLQEKTEEFIQKAVNTGNEQTHQLAANIVAEISNNFSLPELYTELTGTNLLETQENI